MEELDDSWISSFENIERKYNVFYKEKVSSIKICILYIDSNNILQKIVQDNMILEKDGWLLKENLINIIKTREKDNDIKYKLTSLLKYNITIDPVDINNMLKGNINDTYMNALREINNIKYNDTISIFQDLNSMYFIFTELSKKLKLSTTKKIYLNRDNRKTRRKRV